MQFIDGILAKDSKVILTCKKHAYSYGTKKPPVFNCRDCTMVSFVGLMCNTPPEKRQETLEMLEYSVNKLIEADRKGELRKQKFLARPEVTISKE
jgi:hypothetical protein